MSLIDTKAVILAAGNGTRLRAEGVTSPKPLLELHGLSLAERSLAQLQSAGVERFVVVLGNEAERVRRHFEEVAARRGCDVEFVVADNWELGNGCSAAAAEPFVGNEPFLLTMVDHLLSEELIRKVLARRPRYDEIVLAVDCATDAVFDLSDLTKVQVHDGEVRDVGKNLPCWNAGDTGLFYGSPLLFEGLREAQASTASAASGASARYSLSDGVAACTRLGTVVALDVTGGKWMDVDTPGSHKEGQTFLAADLSKGADDGYVSQYLNRPLSRRLSLLLARTAVTPNQLSALSFVVVLIGAACLAMSQWTMWILGGLVIQLGSVLDGCDGEIARLKHQRSARGAWLDTIVDRYADLAIGTAIVFAAARYAPQAATWILGWLAVSSFVLASYVTKEYQLCFGRRYPNNALNRIKRRDLRVLCLAIGAVLGAPFEALLVVGALTHVVVLAIMVQGWRSAHVPEGRITPPPVRRGAAQPSSATLASDYPGTSVSVAALEAASPAESGAARWGAGQRGERVPSAQVNA